MILVTGGCSFSECISPWIDTWPKHLEKSIPASVAYHEGLGCQGNGMISREIIWRVSQLLDQKDNLLVGIMWTGPERHELLLHNNQQPEINSGMGIPGTSQVYNPYNWIERSSFKWLLLHHSISSSQLEKIYYADMDNVIFSLLTTVEHILRVQWFLKLHDIKYFMSTITKQVLTDNCNHPDIKYLYDQIDFDHFLPVDGEYEWCRDYSNLDFPIKGDNHPGSEQHKRFTEQVIIPFLTKKAYI